jgi:hypothetical protein
MIAMKTPDTRGEFERNFHLLHRKMEQGQMHFSANVIHTLDGLEKVRFLPNGRVDFLSVDESARLQANTMNNFPDFPEEPTQPAPPPDPQAGVSTPPGAL